MSRKYLLSKTTFTSAHEIPKELLEDISKCYSQRIQACRYCFLTHSPSTQDQLRLMSVSSGICKKCLRCNGTITVIPKSDFCETTCYGKYVAIPLTPTKANIKQFQYCIKDKEISGHKKCLLCTRHTDPWFPHSIEEMVIWTIEYKLGIPFDSVYGKHCRPAPTLPKTDTNNTSRSQNNEHYCGYCDVQCETAVNLLSHCQEKRHKRAVFADSGRDVFWQHDPPPLKKDKTLTTMHSTDVVKEWKTRCKKRIMKVSEIPFGLNDQSIKQQLTNAIHGLETRLQCSSGTPCTSPVLVVESYQPVTWTLLIKGNQNHSFRGIRFDTELIFQLMQVFHCSTNQDFSAKIINNMCCSTENRPGPLLGLLKVVFQVIPKRSDEYKAAVLIDVGLSKCLSIPIDLKVVPPKLYKLNKCLLSGKLFLNIGSVFSGTKLPSIQQFSNTNKELIKNYLEQMNRVDLYSSDYATLLESNDLAPDVHYMKMYGLLYLEGDHRKRLLQRLSKREIMARLVFVKGPPSMEVYLQELGDALVAECSKLIKDSPCIFMQFQTNEICSGAASHIWECDKELTDKLLRIDLPRAQSLLVASELADEYFSISFEFLVDYAHLAKCNAAVDSFKECQLEHLLFPCNELFHPRSTAFACHSPLKEFDAKLNSQQALAMEAILLSNSVLPVVIAGPFGTGKTFLLSRAAACLITEYEKPFVLVCTLTNSAADVYLHNFDKTALTNCKLLRLTYKGRMVQSLPQHLYKYCLFDSSQKFRFPTKSEAKEYRVIVTTVGMAQELYSLNLTGHFTHIFIDEAAQMTVPEVMMALSLASNATKVVLAGDHMQMNPEVYSPLAKEYNLHRSPLEHLYTEYPELHNSKHKILLTHNYRTHVDILKLPSKFFYRDKLRSLNLIEKHPSCGPLVFLKCDKPETFSTDFSSYFNVDEADKIIQFLKEVLLPNWPIELWGELKEQDVDKIAILTTEYAQVRYIRSCLKNENLPRIFVNTYKSAQGHEFRVVFLSVVRSCYSVNKDVQNNCGYYTESHILNSTFTRVQSLIVTAAHPLSLITRGHMTCRQFWAAYLNQALSVEEHSELKKDYITDCRLYDHKVGGLWQLSVNDFDVYNFIIKSQGNAYVSCDGKYRDQILDDLENEIDDDDQDEIDMNNDDQEADQEEIDMNNDDQEADDDDQEEIDTNGDGKGVNDDDHYSTSTNMEQDQVAVTEMKLDSNHHLTSHSVMGSTAVYSLSDSSQSLPSANTTARGGSASYIVNNIAKPGMVVHANIKSGSGKSNESNASNTDSGGKSNAKKSFLKFNSYKIVHKPYLKSRLLTDKKLYMITTANRAESGYALILNSAEKDIWLPDSSAVNRSLRGDTVAIDEQVINNDIKVGAVIANECRIYNCYPKRFLVCYSDRHHRNLLVPMDNQYPKINTYQAKVGSKGLEIFLHNDTSTYCKNVDDFVYLVKFNHRWNKNHMYPMGKPVNYFRLRGGDIQQFLKFLMFNYIPSMPTYNGSFPHHVMRKVMRKFPQNWKIPDNERENRRMHINAFTIDDEDTVVLDDALSIELNQNKDYVVSVHIADASYFVERGSALDKAASDRGRTFYVKYESDGAVFMLPDAICMNHGSLLAGKERLAVTTQFVFSKRDYTLLSELSDVEVHRSIVCSACRLTKEEVGKFLLENDMNRPNGMNGNQFTKLKENLNTLHKIACTLRKSRWPDSYLYYPDRGRLDRYGLIGSSIVEMFMCLCNTAIPAKLLKRDGRVGPVLVHAPIKHYKQSDWLKDHHKLVHCYPLFKRMISSEVLELFYQENQHLIGTPGIACDPQDTTEEEGITITRESWDTICRLAEGNDTANLATYLCSLNNFPELYVAYRQLCKRQSKSFYDVITSRALESEYAHSHFNNVYTHFTSPLRRYCDILVHRAVLGQAALPVVDHEVRQLLHKMNIHKWDETKFSQQRNMFYSIACCITNARPIAVTAYVGKFTNTLMELHVTPELQEFFPDKVCELKPFYLQAIVNRNDRHLFKWNVEIIPAPGKEFSKENDSKEDHHVVKVPLSALGKVIKHIHNDELSEAIVLIKSRSLEAIKCLDVEQKWFSYKLTVTKRIRQYSKLEIQLAPKTESCVIEPTVSLVHISQTFSCCLLHVRNPIECYAPYALKSPVLHTPVCKNMREYVHSWKAAVEAESVTNSTSSKRIPVIIKDVRLTWTTKRNAQFHVTNYENYNVKFQRPFSVGDYVCIQYRNLLHNPTSEYFQLESGKLITLVAHGRIVNENPNNIKLLFSEDVTSPDVTLSDNLCNVEIIPVQVTFRRIYLMFDLIAEDKFANTLVKEICCRCYRFPFTNFDTLTKDKDDGCQLNEGQMKAVENAAIAKNRFLLIQGPPGTGKTVTCVALIKRFVDYNYKSNDGSKGPTILYCAPSNKAVDVGACTMIQKYPDIHIVRIYSTIIEDLCNSGRFRLNDIPLLAKRRVTFKNEQKADKVLESLEKHSLHVKIRDRSSKISEIKEFVEYEKWICSNESELKCLEDYNKLKEIFDKHFRLKRNAERYVLKQAQVIFCTCSEAGSKRVRESIEQVGQCVIDECGMCTEPETLLPMVLSNKIILVGDHKQLQPVVLNKIASQIGLKISMFQRIFKDSNMHNYCIMLTKQYRMHPSICEFPSCQFYGGKLTAAEQVLTREWPRKLPSDIWKQMQTQRCVFIHVEGTEEVGDEDSFVESKRNELEVKKVKFVVDRLRSNGVLTDEIMVLTPYRAQKFCLRDKLQGLVKVNTIHGSQGRECNVVVLTTVRSLPEEEIPAHPSTSWVNQKLGIVTDEHLMNVAITRAREALCIIGNEKLLRKQPMWNCLLDNYTEHNCVI